MSPGSILGTVQVCKPHYSVNRWTYGHAESYLKQKTNKYSNIPSALQKLGFHTRASTHINVLHQKSFFDGEGRGLKLKVNNAT